MSTLVLDDKVYFSVARTLATAHHYSVDCDQALYDFSLHYLGSGECNELSFTYFQECQHPFPRAVGSKNNKPFYGAVRFAGYLRALNYRAYNRRYPDELKNSFRTEKFTRNAEARGRKLSAVALLKVLHCIRYNTDALTPPALEEMIQILEHCIVCNLPEYKSTPWAELPNELKERIA